MSYIFIEFSENFKVAEKIAAAAEKLTAAAEADRTGSIRALCEELSGIATDITDLTNSAMQDEETHFAINAISDEALRRALGD